MVAVRRRQGGMTEAEASALSQEVGKWRRFRVTGRKAVDGAGTRLIVTDQSTGFKHEIHNADQWREVMSWAHLNVYGTLEDALVEAMVKFQDDADQPIVDVTGTRQRAALLGAAQAAERLLQRLQELSYGLATGERVVAPKGAGTLRWERPRSHWRASFSVDGHSVTVVSYRSAEDCAAKAKARMDAEAASGHRVTGKGAVIEAKSAPRYTGAIWFEGKRHWVTAPTEDACRERLDALRKKLSAQGWRPAWQQEAA